MTCNYRRMELTTEAISSIFYLSDQSRLQFLNIKVSKGRCLAGHWPMGPLLIAQICSHGLLPVVGLEAHSSWFEEILSSYSAKQQKVLCQRNSFL